VLRVYRGWQQAPPTHRCAAARIGFKPTKAKKAASKESEIDAFMAEVNATMGGRPGRR
jgi:hypothetical protein